MVCTWSPVHNLILGRSLERLKQHWVCFWNVKFPRRILLTIICVHSNAGSTTTCSDNTSGIEVINLPVGGVLSYWRAHRNERRWNP